MIDVTLFDGVEELDLCKQCFYDLKNYEATAEHFDRHLATFPSKEPCTVISRQCNRKNASCCKEVHGSIGGR